MKDRARAVVIGGGVGGAAVLYWLARLGWDDVVLVERADLTSGSTFHSAGLVGQLRGSLSLTKMMIASVDLYRSLEEEVGLETGWHEVGSLRLASSEERMEELQRQAGWARDVRAADRADLRRGRPTALPADVHRGRARRRAHPDRRLHRPQPADVRARGGRPAPRGRAPHPHARDRNRRRARPRDRCRDRQGLDRHGGRRQRRRHVRGGDRRAWRASPCRSCRWRTST